MRPTATPRPTPTPTATAAPPALGDILESVTRATVLIETLEKAGSGFFISDDIILSNAHIFDQDDVGSPFVLRNKFNEKIETVLVYRGVLVDVAVLERVSLGQVAGPETTTIPRGAPARLGDRVFVVGFPTRSLQAAAPTIVITAGIVSATPFLQGLKFSNEEPRPMRWVQTDTPFNSGNSGGPLVNEQGEVVGIVTWKFVGATIDGLNMALPIDTALSVIPKSIYDHDAE